ncbi:hypothetical protein SH584_02065 [Sphingomonas sp. LY29]|uniref:tetratricopeptide repeat protein n=1 Tax=Sphingomonas sp. LY29 TaxID=3095341 RepID=UPI002D769391|nr:hypothetical protein [Sphingomonas sp. LY29]WRP26246.1 hypothetical protein SH584_02065 [Sphingomonas sp. LY29]
MKTLRLTLVAGMAISALVLVVRTAAVSAWSRQAPDLAAKLWPGHPQVVIRQGLEAIGRSAVDRRDVNRSVVTSVVSAARKSPLSPEPFVVHGINQQQRGKPDEALASLQAAVRRDPRSIPARYFLAERFAETGQIVSGLQQVSVLSKLVPQAGSTLVPALVKYARMPGGERQLRLILRDNPALEPVLLDALAADPANAALVMSLWSGGAVDPATNWPKRLLAVLVKAEQIDRAYDVWRRVSGQTGSAPALIFNPTFEASKAPPPFNWTLLSSGAGVAEPSAGRLNILYYGRENAVLAQQLLRLTPGRYRLSMRTTGGSENAAVLGWSINCVGASSALVRIPLRGGDKSQDRSADFSVPSGCAAQRLELLGSAPEFPDTVNATVENLRLTKVAP